MTGRDWTKVGATDESTAAGSKMNSGVVPHELCFREHSLAVLFQGELCVEQGANVLPHTSLKWQPFKRNQMCLLNALLLLPE